MRNAFEIRGLGRLGGVLTLALLLACNPGETPAPDPERLLAPEPERLLSPETWEALDRAEERIHALSPDLSRLDFAVRNLALPDRRTRALFAEALVEVRDLTAALEAEPTPRPVDARTLQLWRPLLERIDYFHHARFQLKRGDYAPQDDRTFEGSVRFEAVGRLRSGSLASIEARSTVRWKLAPGSEDDWRITAWETRHLELQEAPAPLFREVLDHALPDLGTRARARESRHEALVSRALLDPESFRPPHEFFELAAHDRHPAVTVADVDGDGFDDLYVMERWGRNLLLRNRGDGTFEDVAAPLGVDVDGHSGAALFADFDNDGDPDLFLGRSLERSRYFENEEGVFRDRSADAADRPLPYLVSSLAAADVDRDGLLDLYVSTYAAHMTIAAYKERRAKGYDAIFQGRFLEEADAARLFERLRPGAWHPNLDHWGPPNLLLRNVGGRFVRVRDEGAEALRNTFQATFADADADGDPDLYLSNDFAPDAFLRNEGGRFAEASDAIEGLPLGFGMGATWGDIDRDGREDLFVTNMSSTAGSRILGRLEGEDPRLAQLAGGNWLFRNEGGTLRRLEGPPPPEASIERTGWSWGSQFLDFDNDGFLDLYTLSGYFTAPPEAAGDVDT